MVFSLYLLTYAKPNMINHQLVIFCENWLKYRIIKLPHTFIIYLLKNKVLYEKAKTLHNILIHIYYGLWKKTRDQQNKISIFSMRIYNTYTGTKTHRETYPDYLQVYRMKTIIKYLIFKLKFNKHIRWIQYCSTRIRCKNITPNRFTIIKM